MHLQNVSLFLKLFGERTVYFWLAICALPFMTQTLQILTSILLYWNAFFLANVCMTGPAEAIDILSRLPCKIVWTNSSCFYFVIKLGN